MSMIIGVGVDLVHVPSFAEQLDQPGSRFDGNFTPGEQRDIAARGGHARHWAARWAAKEALIKAWSGSMYGEEPVMDEFAVAQIEVVSDAWGRPRLLLHGEVAKRLECLVADVSLSHDGDYAMAYVVLSAASK
ncbi:MAG TPA: holo-ACP synthase [Aeromicrobium sp.]|nr:holo-ACP synthase [Aeromicrobium sp.]